MELHFGVSADIGVLQHVLRAAVGASCLHGSKVTVSIPGVPVACTSQCRNGNCSSDHQPFWRFWTRAGARLPDVLRLQIADRSRESREKMSCRNIFREKN